MFLPPSVLKDYALVFSGDPALMLPTDEKEREAALTVARDTGNWTPLLIAGEEPTLFYVRQLSGTTFTWMASQQKRKRLSQQELCELALRLALRKVENFGKFRVEFVSDDGQTLASTDVIDAIYGLGESIGKTELGRDAVAELGSAVIHRATEGLRPK